MVINLELPGRTLTFGFKDVVEYGSEFWDSWYETEDDLIQGLMVPAEDSEDRITAMQARIDDRNERNERQKRALLDMITFVRGLPEHIDPDQWLKAPDRWIVELLVVKVPRAIIEHTRASILSDDEKKD